MKITARSSMAIALLAGFLGTGAAARALTFSFTNGSTLAGLQTSDPTTYNNVRNGFQQAANNWTSLFSDDITINIQIDYKSLPTNVLGSTFVSYYSTPVSALYSQMVADATSADDATAVANLPNGTTANNSFLINRTAGNGNSATPYFDNNSSVNNTQVLGTAANFKALGYSIANDIDARISFTSDTNTTVFDFDRSNGINPNQTDFIGVATHEIGHAMGFSSASDGIDNNPGQAEDNYTPTVLDLYRYSSDAIAGLSTPRRDLTADARRKYFSIDGGATSAGEMSTGVRFGDGNQTSHWKANEQSGTYVGVMDPTAANGELLSITSNDIRAFDVMGYNRIGAGAAMPEPATVWLAAVGGLGMVAGARRKRARRK